MTLLGLTPIFCFALGLSFGILAGFDCAAIAFLTSSFLSMRETSPAMMRKRAELNDARPGWLTAITASVLAIVLFAVTAETNGKGGALETKIAPLVTLALAWVFSNVVFALHYAHMYYLHSDGKDAGGLKLPNDDRPTYVDFCYFSFIIGMTFQVSDIEITSRDIRTVCLKG